ncbi:anthranilate synthase component II [Neorhodopirellula pilleata]|uniref:Anthranilate synthase component 2 n=1 Tax=Neorhodopirellula pilleata TaxID=2714738 RepID=A0A5C6A4S4_9BACT|nr:aminodeoxychorismate/anthranilate synthase component II [Neorhodopirellula pilleata]TWT94370.1 Anthranilate synthase component 2 [Neorhodopirellula pilleata]
MILLLDNYDSFVHNIARYLRLGGKATRVIRSDAITAEQCWRLQPEAIVLSPGPHGPDAAGCCLEVISRLAGEIPMLGICLGHQAIAAAYGGTIQITPPHHAIASTIAHDGTSVFAGLPETMKVGRYHSLCVEESTLPPSLQVTAWTIESTNHAGQRVVMGIADHARCVHGLQFHPESLLTEHGQTLLNQFFTLVDRHHRRRRHVTGVIGNGRPVAWMSAIDFSPENFSPENATDDLRSTGLQTGFAPMSIAAPRKRSGAKAVSAALPEDATP